MGDDGKGNSLQRGRRQKRRGNQQRKVWSHVATTVDLTVNKRVSKLLDFDVSRVLTTSAFRLIV